MTVRVGFYGAGFISRYHRASLAASGVDHRVVAVHDPDGERAAAFAADCPGAVVAGEDELVGMVDAVYVTAWTSEHARLVGAAAAAGVVNQVGLILRFLPSFRWLRHVVQDDRAGDVLAVVFRDDQFIPNQGMYRSTWRVDASRAGRGTLLEHSIHDVDILLWLLGPVSSVSATTREVHGYPRIDDVAVARFDFASGAAGTLTSVWHDVLERPSLRRVEVFCSRLYAALEGDFTGPVRWQFTGGDEHVLEGDDLVTALAEAGDAASANSATAFLRAVADGGPAHPSFAEALPAHRVVDALYASAAAGGAVIACG